MEVETWLAIPLSGRAFMLNQPWGLLEVISLWGWVIAAIFFALRSFPCVGVFCGRSALVSGIPLVALYLLWVVAMLRS